MSTSTTKRTPNAAGTSLVEVVVSTALVGIVLTASLTTLGMSVSTQREAADAADAYALAENLLDEVFALPYEDPDGGTIAFGIEADEDTTPTNRTGFDDLDDFTGWTRTPPEDRTGAALAGFDGWSRSVTVEWLQDEPNATGQLLSSGSESGLKRVTVVVDSPTGDRTEVVGVASRWGAHEAAAALDTTWVTGLSATIATANSDTELTTTTQNEPTQL